MTLSAVIQHTEKSVFGKYKRHGYFRTFCRRSSNPRSQ